MDLIKGYHQTNLIKRKNIGAGPHNLTLITLDPARHIPNYNIIATATSSWDHQVSGRTQVELYQPRPGWTRFA